MRLTFFLVNIAFLGLCACQSLPRGGNGGSSFAPSADSLSRNPASIGLSAVRVASCKSDKGSFLNLDRDAQSLEAQFAQLPKMSNLVEGSRMDIEASTEGNYDTLGSLTVNQKAKILGSIMLISPKNSPLYGDEELLAVFRDMEGGHQEEKLNCRLIFYVGMTPAKNATPAPVKRAVATERVWEQLAADAKKLGAVGHDLTVCTSQDRNQLILGGVSAWHSALQVIWYGFVKGEPHLAEMIDSDVRSKTFKFRTPDIGTQKILVLPANSPGVGVLTNSRGELVLLDCEDKLSNLERPQ